MSRYFMMGAPFAVMLFLAAVVPSQGQSADAAAAGEGGEVFYYDVGHSIQLSCDVPNPDNTQIVWKKNGTLISELADVSGRAKFEGAGGAKLVIPVKTNEDDFGNYTCSAGAGAGAARREWQVRGRPHSKLPANTNVVEGQKLKLQCRVIGKPYAAVTWMYLNATGENATALEALGGRGQTARSEQGVEGAVLLVDAAQRGDAGTYYCAVGDDEQYNGHTELRVKDMYAALWPFLGICAEVLVLCAIILVYEKRRTKPELDDSDTDNHDQKKS